MNVLFLARATLYSVHGGDTVQIAATAKYLKKLGVSVDIKLTNEKIDYSKYDLLHVFNVIRPADMLIHINKSKLPYVLSTIFVDYADYQKYHATGIVSFLNRIATPDQLEYFKAIARWIKNGETINSWEYIYKGHKRSVQQLAENARFLLPNSENEYQRFVNSYGVERPYKVVYNGVDLEVFTDGGVLSFEKIENSVLCVSRIEGKKNHLNLIKALNNTPYNLKIIGKAAPNHQEYFNECKNIAADNITFIDFIPQEKLIDSYRSAKVHVLPSWNETCGLSSLEAGFYNCNLVITDKGDTKDYFGEDAWYCDPGDPKSIYENVVKASTSPSKDDVRKKIINTFNWEQAALQTYAVYKEALNNNKIFVVKIDT